MTLVDITKDKKTSTKNPDVAKFKQIEEALRASEEKLRLIFASIPDSVTVIDLDGMIIDANDAGVRLFGVTSRDQVIGRNGLDFLAGSDKSRALTDWPGIFNKEIGGPGEYKVRKIDGSEFYGEVRAAVVRDKDGKPQGIITVIRDITERKKIERALNVSETRYRRLFEAAKDGILILDAETGMVMDVNPFLIKTLGYSYEQFVGKRIWEVGCLKGVIADRDKFAELQRQEYVRYEDLPLVTSDGRRINVEFIGNVYEVDHTKVVQCNIRDTTERKRAQEALRESEKKYRLLAENASDVITVIDTNMRPIYMSPSITRLLGYSVEESMARGIESGLTPESIKVAAEGFAKAMTEEQKGKKLKPVTIDLEFVRKDGSAVWVAASVVLIRGSDGQPAEILSILHDITERKQAKEDLVKYKDHLEELVKERTAELGKAKIIAEEANKAKSEFLANMSHEIRTPLSSIIGFSELLYDEASGPLNDKQKKYLGYVASSGQHLLSLINDILDLSKVESGKMELLPTSFSIRDLLKSSFSFIVEKALKHNIRLISDISADVDVIEADERKVKQIIYNLLSNAVKFTPDGGSITVRADVVSPDSAVLPIKIRDLPDAEYVLVSVKDTGIGISKKDQSKLFTEFHQIEEPYSKKYEGTGLGLALSKKLVTLHGGRIWFESKGKGKGCTFYFILPLKTLPKA